MLCAPAGKLEEKNEESHDIHGTFSVEGDQSVSSDDDDLENDDYVEKFPNVLHSMAGELDVILEDSDVSLANHSQEQANNVGLSSIQYVEDSTFHEMEVSDELIAVDNDRKPSPVPSEAHSSSSSKHSSNSSKKSSKSKKSKSETIFDTAQKAIIQAQEILQTLSIESSSDSSTSD
jgi:hypothetical protein